MPLDTKAGQEFLTFISLEEGKGKFKNLETLRNFEGKYPGIFSKVMKNFKEAKGYRKVLDETGKPKTISWEEAFEKFHINNKYTGINESNKDIAELLGRKGVSQDVFNQASKLRKEANEKEIPEHILGEPIKEKTILESIEEIKKETANELADGKEIIEELYKKQFTYEWLSKKDPHNSIMGLFVSCCGSINSSSYGEKIAQSSIVSPDVQNLLVRDNQGNIISKGTMYLNKKDGYAVINDFELNEKFRHNEKISGRYNVDENHPEEEKRNLIFETFMRGLETFIEKYNKQNPYKPLKQINIGMGYNRLKKQVEAFEKETENLTVPSEYSFQDAKSEQYILYKRDDEKNKNNKENETKDEVK